MHYIRGITAECTYKTVRFVGFEKVEVELYENFQRAAVFSRGWLQPVVMTPICQIFNKPNCRWRPPGLSPKLRLRDVTHPVGVYFSECFFNELSGEFI